MKDKDRKYNRVVLDFPDPDATPTDKLRWYIEWLRKEAKPGQIVTDSVPRIIDEHEALLVIMECLLTHTHPKYVEKDAFNDHNHDIDEEHATGTPLTRLD